MGVFLPCWVFRCFIILPNSYKPKSSQSISALRGINRFVCSRYSSSGHLRSCTRRRLEVLSKVTIGHSVVEEKLTVKLTTPPFLDPATGSLPSTSQPSHSNPCDGHLEARLLQYALLKATLETNPEAPAGTKRSCEHKNLTT